MIKRLIGSVVDAISSTETEAENRDEALRMATAVLLIDVARADSDFSEDEFDTLLQLVAAHFELPAQDAAELVVAANEKADSLVSVHEFTQLLHQAGQDLFISTPRIECKFT